MKIRDMLKTYGQKVEKVRKLSVMGNRGGIWIFIFGNVSMFFVAVFMAISGIGDDFLLAVSPSAGGITGGLAVFVILFTEVIALLMPE